LRIALKPHIQDIKQADLIDLLLIANYLDIPLLLKTYEYFLATAITNYVQDSVEAIKNYFVNALKGTGKSIPSEMIQEIFSMKKLIRDEAIALYQRTQELNKLLSGKKNDENTVKIRRLIEEGIEPKARASYQETLLIKAISQNNSIQVIQDLINAGVDVNLVAEGRRTALMTVAHAGHFGNSVKIIQALIVAKADLNAKDQYNNTALFIAISSGNNEVAKVLIKAGADVNVPGDWRAGGGITPLNMAVHRGNVELIQALVDAGADIMAVDRNKKNSIDLAKSLNKSDVIIKILQSKKTAF
jgi:ankyrin repeat protein